MTSLRILSTATALLALASSGEEVCAKTLRGSSLLSRLSPTLGVGSRKRAKTVMVQEKVFDLGLEGLQDKIRSLENEANEKGDDALMHTVAKLQCKLAAEQSRETTVNFFLNRFAKGEMELDAGILAFENAEGVFQASLEAFALTKDRDDEGYRNVYMPYYTEAMRLWGQEQAFDDAVAARGALKMRRRRAFRQRRMHNVVA